MTTVEITSDIQVKLIRYMAHDDYVVEAAQASSGPFFRELTDPERLINSLAKNQHSVPFEHNVFTFWVECPIYTSREMVKHRHSSISELSGRYSKMIPLIYTPGRGRMLANSGTSMQPIMELGTKEQHDYMLESDIVVAQHAWDVYEERLRIGIVKEQARSVLPVNFMTQMRITINALSLMNVFRLRVFAPEESNVVSHPQREIEMVAEQMEAEFAKVMPATHEAFVRNGRRI
jgi:thymidylate synthase (FAD)